MTKEEAEKQLRAFFRKLGIEAPFFDEKNFVKTKIGEALIGFEFYEDEEILKAKALIYRFRRAPKPGILSAVFAEAREGNSGGGQIFFDENEFSLLLEKDFTERIEDGDFYKKINILAQASLFWSSRKLRQIAEKAA